MTARTLLRALLVLVVPAPGCSKPPPRNLDALVLRDSAYLEPETLRPFTGDVFRGFADDPSMTQLRGSLRDGAWNGELTVYHRSGRVRYQGVLADGAPCGTWIENRDDRAAESVYQELKQEIESLGLYPPCPDARAARRPRT